MGGLKGVETTMRLYLGEDIWGRTCRMRRIGWIDQKGRVYPYDLRFMTDDAFARFDGGSLSPLLIEIGDD